MSDSSTTGGSVSAEPIEAIDTFDRVLTNEDRVLVDFYADWCGPCQMMAPMIDELAAESDEAVVKVDIEALPQLAARYDVNSIPTFLVFENGEIADRLVGMQEKSTLEQSF